MHHHSIQLLPILLPIILSKAHALTLPQPPSPETLTLFPALPPTNTNTTTTLTSQPWCFKQTRIPPFLPTDKQSCETTLDSWVKGENLMLPRKFSRQVPAFISDDVDLPFQIARGSCVVYADVLEDGEEDLLTLAEVYAELLGPDGLMKKCLGQEGGPAIGGRMTVGRKGLVNVAVMGR